MKIKINQRKKLKILGTYENKLTTKTCRSIFEIIVEQKNLKKMYKSFSAFRKMEECWNFTTKTKNFYFENSENPSIP